MRTRSASIVLLAAAAALTACGGSSGSSDDGAAPAPQQSTTDTSSSAPAAAGTALTIQGFAYSPTPLTVAPGTVISVTNKDTAPHTVTSDTQGLFNADKVTQAAPVTFTAPTKPGTYTYNCAYHSKMHGTLVVS